MTHRVPCKFIIWVWNWFGFIEIPLWWKMRIWNYYETIELSLYDDITFQMKKPFSKWIYSNQNVLTASLTDTSMLYSTFCWYYALYVF